MLGSWLQTLLGFGVAMVAAPIIAIIAPQWVPIILTFSALLLSATNSIQLRAHVETQSLIMPLLARTPASLAAAWLLTTMSVISLQIAVSLCVILAALVTAFAPKYEATPLRLAVASMISGFMGTTTSIGGPPMALVMLHGEPQTVRANLNAYFTISCAVSLACYGFFGLLNMPLLYISLSFIPLIGLGYWLGLKTRGKLKPENFRHYIIVFCGIAGLISLLSVLSNLTP